MNRIVMMAMAGCVATAAHAENTALSDSSKVFDIDEVVVVSQPKEVMRLRQQALSSTSMSSSLMKKMGASDLRDLSLFVPLKSASNLNGNLNCSKELEHYAS